MSPSDPRDAAPRRGPAERDLQPGDPLWDGTGPADPFISNLERALAPARLDTPAPRVVDAAAVRDAAPARWIGGGGRYRAAWIGAAALVAVAAVGVWSSAGGGGEPSSWRTGGVAGAPRLGGRAVRPDAAVPLGRWIETDAASTVSLEAEGVGRVTIEPSSRVRVAESSDHRQRLELAAGSIDAFVITPPRLFLVDTPAAQVVDMGCSYTLRVDESGDGELVVRVGWVDLERGELFARVPAGARAEIRSGAGPGVPWFDDAPMEVANLARAASARSDVGELPPALLAAGLAAARARDSLTLWHLANRATGADRAAVVATLAGLVPPPRPQAGSDAGAMANPGAPDGADMEAWWADVRRSW